MTAKECITGRRSIRQFKSDAIDHKLIEEIVSEAAFAPSWKNTQIARYIAVEGDLKAKVAECTSAHPNNGRMINEAPMVIAVAVKTGRCGFERDGSFTTDRGDSWQMFDAGVAAQTFCLAAYEHGLGTVILGIFDHKEAAKVLGLPEDMDLVTLIPIGYPNEAPAAPKRKEVEELLSFQ